MKAAEGLLGGLWQEDQAHKLNDGRQSRNTQHPPACISR